MFSPPLRILLLGLISIALSACVEIEPATGSPVRTAALLGADLGSSGRVPQIAGLAGEGEGYGRTEPNPSPVGHGSMDHGAMGHGSMDHGTMDHGSKPGTAHRSKDHSSTGGMSHASMGHGSVHGMKHGSTDHGSMSGMRHGSGEKMAAAQSSASGKWLGSGGKQMAHSGHVHVQGTGTVNSVDAANRKVNVNHAPIPKIGWPTMTMDFAVAPSIDLNAVKPGTRIKFDMEQGQGGMYVIQSIAPAGGGR